MKKIIFILSILFLVSCKNESIETSLNDTIYIKTQDTVYLKNNTIVLTDKQKEDSIIKALHKDVNVEKVSLSEIKERLKRSRNVSNRPLKLADYLETASLIIKNEDTRYRWNEQGSCNVGIVAQLVTGLTPLEIESFIKKYPLPDRKYEDEWTWSGAVSQYCPITGKTEVEILDKIMSVGMDREDFYHLEYLSNDKILKKANLDPNKVDYTNSNHLVLYMETWAKMIRDFHKKQSLHIKTGQGQGAAAGDGM